jgi:hypothetical protein
MRIAMYKGPPDDFWHKVGHTATCLWTRSKYSHCELVFSAPGTAALGMPKPHKYHPQRLLDAAVKA